MSDPGGPMAAEHLISFRPSITVQQEFRRRGGVFWHIQGIENGAGPVNLDNYRVKILELPSLKGLDSLRGLLNYVRLNINRFVDPDRARFSPYSAADAARWNSNYPLGAVLHIDLGADWGALNPEDGSVLCSSHSDTHWTFSTVHTPADQYHPVSGNREFGFYTLSGPSASSAPYGGSFIYVRAADRVSPSYFNEQLSTTIFSGGHQTWLSFQHRLAGYINAIGGKAIIVPAYSTRYAWDVMAKKHRPRVDWAYKDGPPRLKRETDELSTGGGPV
jgi:hypothetical protein